MVVLKERKKKIKDILTPHILYGKLSEEQIIEMIRIESADYKNKSAGKMGELRSEIERRRLLRLRRLNPDEFDRRIDKMLERPSKDVDEKRTRLPRGLTPMQEKFCMEYAATGDELASYKKAGFKEAKEPPLFLVGAIVNMVYGGRNSATDLTIADGQECLHFGFGMERVWLVEELAQRRLIAQQFLVVLQQRGDPIRVLRVQFPRQSDELFLLGPRFDRLNRHIGHPFNSLSAW